MLVDFVETNLTNLRNIVKPESQAKTEQRSERRPFTSIKIEKSFVPEKRSSFSDAYRTQVEGLRQGYKKQLEDEKKAKALLAEGKITREEMNDDRERPRKEQPVVQ